MNNLLPIVMLIAEIGNVGDIMGRTTGSARYMAMMMLFDEATGLASVDFSKVPEELKAALADSEKMSEIQAKFAGKFDIADDQLEGLIEEVLLLAKENYEIVKKDITFINKIKDLKKA